MRGSLSEHTQSTRLNWWLRVSLVKSIATLPKTDNISLSNLINSMIPIVLDNLVGDWVPRTSLHERGQSARPCRTSTLYADSCVDSIVGECIQQRQWTIALLCPSNFTLVSLHLAFIFDLAPFPGSEHMIWIECSTWLSGFVFVYCFGLRCSVFVSIHPHPTYWPLARSCLFCWLICTK